MPNTFEFSEDTPIKLSFLAKIDVCQPKTDNYEIKKA